MFGDPLAVIEEKLLPVEVLRTEEIRTNGEIKTQINKSCNTTI